MKNRRAFSLVEIGIMIFVVAAVFFAVVPFSVSNIKQAKYIAAWKNYLNQVNYSYEVLMEYQKENPLDKKNAFNRLMKYLDAKKISNSEKEVKIYHYKMMNGKFFQKIKLEDFDEIYKDINGRLIGVEYKKLCKNNQQYITVWVDLNGKEKPNIVGNDIFIYEILEDKIQVYGEGVDFNQLKKDCSFTGSGKFCSKYFLIGGDLR